MFIRRLILFICVCFICISVSRGQASFTVPDTVCVGELINAVNTSQGGNSFYWNFCSGGVSSNPVGSNLGNLGGTLSNPVRVAFVKSGSEYFTFAVNYSNGTLVRNHHGNSPFNTPISVNLGNFGGIIPAQAEGIKVLEENGNWYGFLVGSINNSRLVKFEFGNSLLNTPVATDLGNIGAMSFPHEIQIYFENGEWFGFVPNGGLASITRLSFGNSLTNIPTGVNLGNIGNLTKSTGIGLIRENGLWYGFVVNTNSHSLTRLDFGNSLFNTPTGVNLGNPNGLFNYPFDITFIQDCDRFFGLVANHSGSNLLRLEFPQGATGIVTASAYPNFAGFNQTEGISEIIRVNDTLVCFTTNGGNATMSIIGFPSCSNSNPVSSNQFNPPPFSYSSSGVYDITLVVDEGQIFQSNICRTIVVINDSISINIESNSPVCIGDEILLFSNEIIGAEYFWTGPNGFSSNIQNPIISSADLTMSGYYGLQVSTNSCNANPDSIYIEIVASIHDTINANICDGDTYFAAGAFQTSSGTYIDTFVLAGGCENIVFTQLNVIQNQIVQHNYSLCNGDSLFGVVFTNDTSISYQSQTANGCDSIVIIEIEIVNTQFAIVDTNFCEGNIIIINNVIYDSPGTHVDTLTASSGCDSIVTLQISMLSPAVNIIDTSFCPQNPIFINGVIYQNAGVFNDTLTSMNGCDSILTINIVSLESLSFIDTTFCQGSFILINNSIYETQGVYYDTLLASNGCDSIIVIELVEKQSSIIVIDTFICNGEIIELNGNIFDAQGIYSDTLVAENGCDSIVTINISFFESVVSIDTFFCPGNPIAINNILYNSEGIYYDTLTASNGCDSILIINLSVSPPVSMIIDTNLCEGFSIILNDKTYNVAGTYYDSISMVNGCDSFFVINISTLEAKYSFIDTTICPDSLIIVNERIIRTAGHYFDTLTSFNSCDSIITTIVNIENSPFCYCEKYFIPNAFSPNDDGQNDVFNVLGGCFKNFHLQIFDRWGEKVFESFDQEIGWDGTFKNKRKSSAVFVYVFHGITLNNVQIKDKGSFVLVL